MAGSSLVEGGVEALSVVVAVDERGDFGTEVAGVDEAAVLQHLSFERAHERLGSSVVAGIGSCGHALAHSREPQVVAEGSAAVLTASVAREAQPSGVASGGDGLLHGNDDQIAAQVIGQGPANDASGAQVDDDGEVASRRLPRRGGCREAAASKCLQPTLRWAELAGACRGASWVRADQLGHR